MATGGMSRFFVSMETRDHQVELTISAPPSKSVSPRLPDSQVLGSTARNQDPISTLKTPTCEVAINPLFPFILFLIIST